MNYLEEKSIELVDMIVEEPEKVRLETDMIYGRLAQDIRESVKDILDWYCMVREENEYLEDKQQAMEKHIKRLEKQLQEKTDKEIVTWEEVENNL